MIRNPPRSLPPGGSIAVISALPSLSRNVRKGGISRCTWASRPMSRSIALGRPGWTALSRSIFLDSVPHQARLMHRFTFRLDTEPSLTL
jgi:hypothetical protein